MTNEKTVKEPLFHVAKRSEMVWWKALLVRVAATFVALIIGCIMMAIVAGANPFVVFGTIFYGAFKDPFTLMQNTVILLAFGLAIVPAFKMKYWNMGANGQVLVGCLAAVAIMFHLGDALPNPVLWILMFVCSLLASVLWAVIPAVFKAYFNTNETLFTLMMNYIAYGLVSYLVFVWDKSGSGTLGVVNLYDGKKGWLPVIGNQYVLPIVVIMIITAFIYVYMRYSKHGYEIGVVGESVNTAKYAGMNVKYVIIRTLILSGIICGIMGFLYAGAINHTVNQNLCGSNGFSAILIAWLSNFNPLVMIGMSLFFNVLTLGTAQVGSSYQLGNDNLGSIVIGIVFFFLIACEFLIRYVVKFNFKRNKDQL